LKDLKLKTLKDLLKQREEERLADEAAKEKEKDAKIKADFEARIRALEWELKKKEREAN